MDMKLVMVLFLLLPLLGQFYISWRVWQLLPAYFFLRLGTVVLITVCFLAFFVAMSGWLDALPMNMASLVYNTGCTWVIILLYLLLIFLLADAGRLFHLIPKSWLMSNQTSSIALFTFMTILMGYGAYHYEDKERVHLSITTPKELARPVRFLMVSDLHLGYHNRRADLHRWIDLLNRENADALLIAGDIVDSSIRPVLDDDMAAEFHRLHIPIYAIYGNHDYYASINRDSAFCKEAGITVLRDRTVHIAGVTIVGRDDRTNNHRQSLQQLMKNVDHSQYTIVLDHQPYHLEEAERCKADYEFCGHTHYGQVWPLSWITNIVYECAFGPYKRGITHYYVSSGLGIWGAKLRIGTQSEYIVADIESTHH